MSNYTNKRTTGGTENVGATPFAIQVIYDAAEQALAVDDTIDVAVIPAGTQIESVDMICLTANTDATVTIAAALVSPATAMIAANTFAAAGAHLASTRTTVDYCHAATTLRLTAAVVATTNLKLAIIIHGWTVPAVSKTNSLTAVA